MILMHRIFGAVEKNGFIYFASAHHGAVYSFHMQTKLICKVAELKSEKHRGAVIDFKDAVIYGDSVIFAAYESEDCYIYDDKNNSVQMIENYIRANSEFALANVHISEDKLYFVPQSPSRKLAIYDGEKFASDPNWSEGIKKIGVKKTDILFFNSAIILDTIWTGVDETGKLIAYHIGTGKVHQTEVNYCCKEAFEKNGKLWILLKNQIGCIVYDPRLNTVSEIFEDVWQSETKPYSTIAFNSKYAFLIPFESPLLLIIEIESQQVVARIDMPYKCYKAIAQEDKLYLLPCGYETDDIFIQEIDLTNGFGIAKYDHIFDDNDYWNPILNAAKSGTLEEGRFGLEDFLQLVNTWIPGKHNYE